MRRVATLVAQDVPASEVFSAVAHEVGTLLGTDCAGMVRFDDGALIIVVVVSSDGELLPTGTRYSDDASASMAVYRTGRPARVDARDWSTVEGIIGTTGRGLGVVSTP